MARLVQLILKYGVPLVALNVFLEQIGAPVPAVPTMIVAGALTREGRMSSTHLILAAIVASLVADYIWFLLGRRYGYRILRTLCRISLSPDSCVRDTEASFERWGMKSLLIAKFIPGFSTVAPPLAGATGASSLAFLIYDGIGAFIWAAASVATGRAFHHAIALILARLESLGWWAVVFAVSLLALIIAVKWWQRLRFYKRLRVARVSVDELKAMLDNGDEPVVLDVRAPTSRKIDPRGIPTAIVAETEHIDRHIRDVPPHREIILYCT
jgi:membrane protein DedA with SNARE-associated domain